MDEPTPAPSAPTRPRGWALIPPPVLFIGAFIVGVLLTRWFPVARIPATMTTPLRWVGVALLIIGAAHALTSASLFALARTTIIPHHASSALVTGGAYRWTRNPMYVGMTLMYLGGVAALGALWPLLTLVLPLIVLDRRIIPMEERQLARRFGASYADYSARVRRWL